MERYFGKYAEDVYSVLRIVAGAVFMEHGAQKLFGALGGLGAPGASAPLFSLLGAAGVIEFFGGLLIATGLFAGYAAFIAFGEMAVAYLMVHRPRGQWPIRNGGELALLYAAIFLYVAFHGAGTWSLDAVLGKMRRPKTAGSPSSD
jgi:putative oxidoreductase